MIIKYMLYLLLLNGVGYLCMYVDKKRARKQQWRIPEKRLFLVALLGGSIGMIAGMYRFRHKTRHRTFVWGLPVILCMHIAIGIVWFVANSC